MSRASDFETAVAALYRSQGWHVESDSMVAGCQLDLLATRKSAGIAHAIAVECTTERVTARKYASDFAHLISIRHKHPTYRLCIVSEEGFTRGVKQRADASQIDLITYTDLQASVLGFDPTVYASALIHSEDWCSHQRNFVEPTLTWDASASDHAGTVKAFDLLKKWLSDSPCRVLTILGDYGTGKTLLSRAFASRLAESFLEAPSASVLPLFIELRSVRHCTQLDDVVSDHMRSAGMTDANSAAILALLEDGNVALILDGLDEFVDQYDISRISRVLLEFTQSHSKRARILLTCRTHYFRSALDQERALSPELQDSNETLVSPIYRQIISRGGCALAYLDMFSEEMIESYFHTTLGESKKRLEKHFPWLRSLQDLMARPILLDMIATTLPRIGELKGDVTEYDLYDMYTRLWAKRDAWRESWNVEARLSFVRSLAFSLFTEAAEYIPCDRLLKGIGPFLTARGYNASDQEIATIESDARTATFLIRDSEGNYRFAHRSFYEFFLAQFVISEINNGRGRNMSGRMFPKWLPWNTGCFMKPFVETDRIRFKDLLPSNKRDFKVDTFLMIDDAQCGENGIGPTLARHWSDEIGGDTNLVCIPDSISGLIYTYYLCPLAVMHDNFNLIAGPAFAEHFRRHLAPLGILLVLHHATFDEKAALQLMAEGTVVGELRKPYEIKDLKSLVARCTAQRSP